VVDPAFEANWELCGVRSLHGRDSRNAAGHGIQSLTQGEGEVGLRLCFVKGEDGFITLP
jgi:hypothetical protein